MLLIDILKYFYRFSTKEGVLNNFSMGESRDELYESLKVELSTGDYMGIVPEFVISSTFDRVKSRIANILSGTYLFVDYGDATHQETQPGLFSDSVSLAVTVAAPVRTTSVDTIEQLLVMEDCLAKLVEIRNLILSNKCSSDPFYRGLKKYHKIVPFDAPSLFSVGWSLLFSAEGYDSFRAK